MMPGMIAVRINPIIIDPMMNPTICPTLISVYGNAPLLSFLDVAYAS